MPGRQVSTAVSDLVLAFSAVYFVFHVIFVNFFAAVGIAIQGAAAAMGVARFGMAQVDPQITQYHKMLSWLAQVVGIPLLGIGFVHNIMPTLVTLNFLFVIGVVVASRFVDDNMRKLLREATSGFGMLSVILASFYTINIFGLIGAAIYVASGLVVGSEGYVGDMNMPRIDLLHYCLAVGNVFFLYAFLW
ncbi:hypothetical protein BaRGS_00025716 [Batillaria attramentaria]|uniref:Uncharacterized protein n=1 Tax=Batillaria attramentaria TaxID=370345 RepID=A0ABD0K7Q4_9CAEN